MVLVASGGGGSALAVDVVLFVVAVFVVRHVRVHLAAPATARLEQLFHAVGVAESVECVFTGARVGTNVGDHDGARVADEGVLEHLGELAASERQMALYIHDACVCVCVCVWLYLLIYTHAYKR